MDRQSFDDGMARLRGLFIRKLCDRHDRLELLAQALAGHADPVATTAEIEGILHKIAGSAGSVGLHELGEEASRLECLIRDQRALDRWNVADIADGLDSFLDMSLDICEPVEDAAPLPNASWAAVS